MNTYVISDIHGCFGKLQAMLKKIEFSENDQLVIAGDYIDRGPQIYEMLQWIENCPENVLLLCGNHDKEFAANIELMEQVYNGNGFLRICNPMKQQSCYMSLRWKFCRHSMAADSLIMIITAQ